MKFYTNLFKQYILSSLSYILGSIISGMRLDWTDKEDFEHFFITNVFEIFQRVLSKKHKYLGVIEDVLSTTKLNKLF